MLVGLRYMAHFAAAVLIERIFRSHPWTVDRDRSCSPFLLLSVWFLRYVSRFSYRLHTLAFMIVVVAQSYLPVFLRKASARY
ncbi:MAG TPA: hypothetical protein VGO47_09310 [Chlamydiales bacterium]|nr:hypothetical protein [Chlamydiales bacterium]